MLPDNRTLLERFGKNATIAGIVMMLLGLVGLFYPFWASLFTVSVIAWLMVFAGSLAGYFTFQTNRSDWLGWLKSVILIGTGLLMLFYPKIGVVALGLLFTIYFMMDGFSGVAIALSSRPEKGWWIWLINGLLSFALAVIFMMSWTSLEQTAWLIGIFVGISLFFDGFTLLFMGNVFKTMSKE
jgi:uncharacterized membrane protein HdeD (DUF308 family)